MIKTKKISYLLLLLLLYSVVIAQNQKEQTYPKLGVKKFSGKINNIPAVKELECYGLIACPQIMSSNLGVFRGHGSYHDTIYNFNHDYGGISEHVIDSVKRYNSNVMFFAYSMGPKKLELNKFWKGKNQPFRYLVDNISPKWFAYTVLDTITQNLSNNPFDTVLHVTPAAAHRIYYAMKNHNIPDSALWMKPWVYNWTYICFKDNDSNATRGNFEIMAVKKVNISTGEVIVAVKREHGDTLGRTIFGVTLSYTHGDRAGVLALCDSTQGTPGVIMNCYYNPSDPKYKTEMLADTNDWSSDWLGALTEYIKMVPMQAKVGSTYLCDGIMMDTDDEYWKAPTYHLANPDDTITGYVLDMNWDGQVDSLDTVNSWLPQMYHNLLYRIDTAAQSLGRDFFVIRNGHIVNFGNTVGYVAGREFEDFGMFSQDSTYEIALNQYKMLADTNNTTAPHVTMLCERDRAYAKNHQHNYKEHRHKMALTTVLGEGYYTHTGNHSSHITAWGNDTSLTDGPEDWFDEYAVDSLGRSAKILPASNALDTANNRLRNIGWLGRALSTGYAIDTSNNGNAFTYRRDFEKGIVIYSQYAHTLQLDTLYKKIEGADPGNTGDTINTITFNTSKMGIFLLRLHPLSLAMENQTHTEDKVLIYPNPADNIIRIKMISAQPRFVIEIWDVTGKLLLRNDGKTNYTEINTSGLANGIYFISVTTEKQKTIKKIIINH